VYIRCPCCGRTFNTLLNGSGLTTEGSVVCRACERHLKNIEKKEKGMLANCYAPKDFPEDAKHENGNYYCHCTSCGTTFIGHKRRITCKLCEKKKEEWVSDFSI
jgi:hypothetical protein